MSGRLRAPDHGWRSSPHGSSRRFTTEQIIRKLREGRGRPCRSVRRPDGLGGAGVLDELKVAFVAEFAQRLLVHVVSAKAARDDKPQWMTMVSIASRCQGLMKLTIFMGPPQREQAKGSTCPTRLTSAAPRRRAMEASRCVSLNSVLSYKAIPANK